MCTLTVKRRTFEAKKHPAGSDARANANKNVLTSEYYPGSPYLLLCHSDSGELAWTRLFRTKREAVATKELDERLTRQKEQSL